MLKYKIPTGALIAVVSLLACDRVNEMAEPSADRPVAASVDEVGQAAAATMAGPRVIRTATGSIEVRDLDDAITSLRGLVQSVNGVVAESQLSSDSDFRSGAFVLRVASESLDSLVNSLPSLGEVRAISMSSTDVSREYFDVETRLAVKEASVQRLTQLIGRATRIEDVVAVERELSRATAELESLKGQITYFDRKTAESELRLHLGESGNGFGATTLIMLSRAFRNAGTVVADSIAALIYVLAFVTPWLVLALILWPVSSRLIRRLRP